MKMIIYFILFILSINLSNSSYNNNNNHNNNNNNNHPIKDLPNKVRKYDECGEIIPNFQYNLQSYYFVNNSLNTLLKPDPKDNRILSKRCSKYIEMEYENREKYRLMKRCDFLKLPRLCPKKKLSNIKLYEIQNLSKKKGMYLVFLILMSHRPGAALSSVETILNSELYVNDTIRFIFHLDSSSSNELWKNITTWVSSYPNQIYLIPRNQAIDVEWGDISTVEAIYLAMNISHQKWNNRLTTFIVLSETNMLVAPLTSIYLFFHRYIGLSYPGGKPGLVSGNDSTWKLCLNDVSIVCDRRIFHLGWRKDPISNVDEYYHGVHLFSFWSSSFLTWLLDTEDGINAYKAIYQRLRLLTTSDEFFWGTLFYNSPFCHQLAKIYEYKLSTGQELSANIWSQECDSSDNWGKESCQSMIHQPIGWWSGNSPEWINIGDIPQLLARQPLFIRKVNSDEGLIKKMMEILKLSHNVIYNTYLSLLEQKKIILSLLSTEQQQNSNNIISLSPLSLSSSFQIYKRSRVITESDTLLSTDSRLPNLVNQEIIQEYTSLVINSNLKEYKRFENVYYLTTISKKQKNIKKKKCIRIDQSNGAFIWVKCKIKGTSEDPTPFILRNCIGNITFASNKIDNQDEKCNQDEEEKEEKEDEEDEEEKEKEGEGENKEKYQQSKQQSKLSLIQSSAIYDGFLYGHCNLVSIGSVKTLNGIPFCLSPSLLKFNPNYANSVSPITFNDIAGQRIAGSGIGFLPCDVDYSIGYAEQFFVFQDDSTIEYATRQSKSRRYLNENLKNGNLKNDTSLCVIKRDGNQLGLETCSKRKKKEKITLIQITE